ncbi:MAG TPA: hypothetical protein QF882_12895, partial [Arenicellales bacterium]|nr:hypothetical protein [Arenicellales bacterium]
DSYIGKKLTKVEGQYDKLLGQTSPITLNGLLAVAHLGGRTGLKKFLQTNGTYNPADSNGTRLSDYLEKFNFNKGGEVVRQGYNVGSLVTRVAIPLVQKGLRKFLNLGSGLGHGTKELSKSPLLKNSSVKSSEPFANIEKINRTKGILPDYTDADSIILSEGINSQDGIVNHMVLNVIKDRVVRDNVVKNIGGLLKKDGIGIITTRDIIKSATKKAHLGESDAWIIGKGKNQRFQKGFKEDELKNYVQRILNKTFGKESFEVIVTPKKYKVGGSSVIVKKLKETKEVKGFVEKIFKRPVTKDDFIDPSLTQIEGTKATYKKLPQIFDDYLPKSLDDLLKKIKTNHGIKRDTSAGVGKKIGGELYVHKSSENVIPNLESFKSKLPKDFTYDIVKHNSKDDIVSFIKSPNWNTVDEPLATTGLKVLSNGTTKELNINQIYHHKWLFVKNDYKGFDVEESIKRSLAWLPLRKDNKIKDFKWASIGRQDSWDKVIPHIPKLSVGGQVRQLLNGGGSTWTSPHSNTPTASSSNTSSSGY